MNDNSGKLCKNNIENMIKTPSRAIVTLVLVCLKKMKNSDIQKYLKAVGPQCNDKMDHCEATGHECLTLGLKTKNNNNTLYCDWKKLRNSGFLNN